MRPVAAGGDGASRRGGAGGDRGAAGRTSKDHAASCARAVGQPEVDVFERGRRTSRSGRSRPRASAHSASSLRWTSGASLWRIVRPVRRRAGAPQPSGQVGRPSPSGSVKRPGRHPVPAAERLRRALGDDPSGGDHGDPVGQVLGLVHVVSREEDRLAERAQALDHVPGGAPGRRVEAGRRLVEEDELRVADQGEGHVEPSALPARELLAERVRLLLQPDERDRLLDVARRV